MLGLRGFYVAFASSLFAQYHASHSSHRLDREAAQHGPQRPYINWGRSGHVKGKNQSYNGGTSSWRSFTDGKGVHGGNTSIAASNGPASSATDRGIKHSTGQTIICIWVSHANTCHEPSKDDTDPAAAQILTDIHADTQLTDESCVEPVSAKPSSPDGYCSPSEATDAMMEVLKESRGESHSLLSPVGFDVNSESSQQSRG